MVIKVFVRVSIIKVILVCVFNVACPFNYSWAEVFVALDNQECLVVPEVVQGPVLVWEEVGS